jgi:hypothetical protein
LRGISGISVGRNDSNVLVSGKLNLREERGSGFWVSATIAILLVDAGSVLFATAWAVALFVDASSYLFVLVTRASLTVCEIGRSRVIARFVTFPSDARSLRR